MDERVEMVNCVTGTTMFVPVSMAAAFEAAGHKRATTSDPRQDTDGNVPEMDTGNPGEGDVPKMDTGKSAGRKKTR